jgi:hypothetical protein
MRSAHPAPVAERGERVLIGAIEHWPVGTSMRRAVKSEFVRA